MAQIHITVGFELKENYNCPSSSINIYKSKDRLQLKL